MQEEKETRKVNKIKARKSRKVEKGNNKERISIRVKKKGRKEAGNLIKEKEMD